MTTGGRWARSSSEDELLSWLYQQVTELQAARFADGYDIVAGRNRYYAWLREQAAENPAAVPASTLMPLHTDPGGAEVADADRGIAVLDSTGVMTSGVAGRGSGGSHGTDQPDWADRDVDRALTTLYRAHYRSLVRLAALLTEDPSTAEGIVQDSFVAVHAAWPRQLDNDQAVAYLRRLVVSRCHSQLRRRPPPAIRNAPRLLYEQAEAERSATAWPARTATVAALRALPPRQREALVLRYYGDLSESQIAAVMGISKGAVRTHTARAISSLSAALERHDHDLVPLDPRHKAPADNSTPEWPEPDGHRYA